VKGAVRTLLIAAAFILMSAGCADAPITAADLQDDGQLREQQADQQSVHAASSIHRPSARAQVAEHLRVTGLVAAEAEGPLEDATRFSLDSTAIHLHLRADGLDEPRPVTFVWLHGDQRRETLGFLQPSETISPVASLPLARYVEEGFATVSPAMVPGPEIDPEALAASLAGPWKVEVYSTDANGRSLVFEREFEILEAESYETWQAWQLAQAEGSPSNAGGVSN
jgi:hypothetical protein